MRNNTHNQVWTRTFAVWWALLASALAAWLAMSHPRTAALLQTAQTVLADLPVAPYLGLASPLPETARETKKRNFVFMVSDGMGPASLSMARSFGQHIRGLDPLWTMEIDKHFIGNSRTRAFDTLVTDSAAGATAFACGLKTYDGAVGVDPNQKPCGTVLEAAKLAGYTTGLVVTTRITDATPGAFAAHVNWRSQEDEIAEQLLGIGHPFGQSPVDLMIGGGRCHFLPRSHGGCRSDKRNLLHHAQKNSWSVAQNLKELDDLRKSKNGLQLPLMALVAQGDIPYDLDRLDEQYPSLADSATIALEALAEATKDSDQGFFVMIEGSRIDHAGHQNDPVAQVHEVLAYDEAWKAVLKFIDNSDTETVVVSTSDHETGGLSVSRQVTRSYPDYLWLPEVLGNASHSSEFLARKLAAFEARSVGDLAVSQTEKFVREEILGSRGLNLPEVRDHDVQLVIRHRKHCQDVLAQLVSFQAQIGWATHGHSAVDVNVYAYAKNESVIDPIRGGNENIDFAYFMADYLGVKLSDVSPSPQ